LIIEKDIDLLLTDYVNNIGRGISGHIFEIIEYYMILKNHFKIKILIYNIPFFKDILLNKYNFDKDEIKDILNNTIFYNKIKLIKTKNIFFVNGRMSNIYSDKIICDNIITFACASFDILNNKKNNVHILLDYRIYPTIPENGIDYKKKILFSRYRETLKKGNKTLLYVTDNCRKISKYPNVKNPLIISDKNKPLINLFDEISSYYYTPVLTKFDCSPRLPAECKFYKKRFILDKEVIDYLELDKGLFYRLKDIQYDFESLFLTNNDEIINIIKGIIWKNQ